MMLPTYAEIMDGRTSRRNWRRSECAAWGVGFPPPAGFPNRLYPQTSQLGMLIPCTRGFECIVDADDYERLADFYWVAVKGSRPGRADYFQPLRCIRIGGRRGAVSMGREILQPEDGLEVDHINGNPFDNRRCNLRLCSHAENVINRAIFCNNLTGYKGVRAHKSRFRAVIHINGKRREVGSFATAEDAARAYDQVARELHGEFAVLNFPEGVAA